MFGAAALLALTLTLLRLTPAVAWDLRLPTALFVVPWLVVAGVALAAGWRGLALLRGGAPSRRSRSRALLVALAGAIALLAFVPVSRHYFEPGPGPSLDSFDAESWPGFDPGSWLANKQATGVKLNAVLGLQPTPRARPAELLGEDTLDGFTRRRYELRVEDSGVDAWDRMGFYLLLPDTPVADPPPVVIVHHQHGGRFDKAGDEPAGVRGDPRQAFGVELARAGLAAACPDAVGFGPRRERDERYTAMRLAMRGRSVAGKYVFDVARLVDALEQIPEVDGRRVGIAGHSLGGFVSLLAAARDRRLGAVASSAGIARLEGPGSLMTVGHSHAIAFYLPGALAEPMPLDARAVVGLLGERPLYLSTGARDELFPVEGVAEIHAWLEQKYARAGAADRLVTERHSGAHRWPAATRAAMLEFLRDAL